MHQVQDSIELFCVSQMCFLMNNVIQLIIYTSVQFFKRPVIELEKGEVIVGFDARRYEEIFS